MMSSMFWWKHEGYPNSYCKMISPKHIKTRCLSEALSSFCLDFLPNSTPRSPAETHSANRNKSICWASEIVRRNALMCCCKITWKRTKWMRKRRRRGRLNQKRSSAGWTIGTPLTTSPRSMILTAILVMITWSFVPTRRITCDQRRDCRFNLGRSWIAVFCCVFSGLKTLTNRGIKGSHRLECQPAEQHNR